MTSLPLLWRWSLGMLLGVQLIFYLDVWLPLTLLLLLPLLSLRLLMGGAAGCSGLLFGVSLVFWHLVLLHATLPSAADQAQPVELTGRILAVESGTRPRVRFKLEACWRSADQQPCDLGRPLSSQLLLTWMDQQMPQPGERWQLRVHVRPITSLHNLGRHHRLEWHYAQRRLARAWVESTSVKQRLAPAQGWIAWRDQRLIAASAATEPSRGQRFYLALALGEQSALTAEDWQLLQATGTVHLWVVSGLHLGLLAGFALLGVRWRWWSRGVGVMLAAALVIFYAALSGWGVAAQRASLMLLMGLLVLSGWRRLSPWTPYFIALSLLLVINPWWVFLRGFWLSFAAVAILILALRGLAQRPLIWQWWRVQWVMLLAFTPVLIWQGGYWSVWALGVNWILVPLIGMFVLPATLISLIEIWLLGSGWIAQWVVLGLDAIATALEQVSQWPRLTLERPGWLWLGLLALLPPGFFGRHWALLGLLLACWPAPATLPDAGWRVWVLDVGQGTAVLVESEGEYLLYDTGPGWQPDWAPLLPALEGLDGRVTLGWTPWILDWVVLSHDDLDHRGGFAALLRHHQLRHLVTPAEQAPLAALTAQPSVPSYHACFAGQRWQLGAVDILALWPPQPVSGRVDNAHSCVMLLRGAGHSLLLTGDAGWPEEAFFAQALPDLLDARLSLLITGHHGSRHSTSAALIRATQPQWAVHTSGWQNHYGHPDPQVQQRLWHAGVQQLDTGLAGAVVFHFDQDHLQVEQKGTPALYWWLRKPPRFRTD
ncbi:DNA internalization-related competence protein ComEC/Rec2 [Marinospirillum sp. MEB164]|uniref:DNA internalization-related competence protein ComEC/Rec2 n=1 Tax=Marinospirillum alkalitolerans TaxID=3123374 RepID=A0ABW8PVW7_9GAMM